MSNFDGVLSSQFLLYTHTRLNPHCSITMEPNLIYQALTMDRANSNGCGGGGELKKRLLSIPSLWYFEGRKLNLDEAYTLRLVIIFQYYLFMFRYGFFQYCADQVVIPSFQALIDAMNDLASSKSKIGNFKTYLPSSYRLSAPCRYHKQLFQISKQYQNTATCQYNAEIQIILNIVTSRITAHPLWIIPVVMPWTMPILRAIMSQLRKNIWAGGQTRPCKIYDLTTTVCRGGFCPTAVSHTMCIIYNTLNSYLNWMLFGLQQMVVADRMDPSVRLPELDTDMRCTLCLRSMVVRFPTLTSSGQTKQANKRRKVERGDEACAGKKKKKNKNLELQYCSNDFCYLSNCCYALVRRVPLIMHGARTVVYTAAKTRYGVCACGTMCVEEPIKKGKLRCDACNFPTEKTKPSSEAKAAAKTHG